MFLGNLADVALYRVIGPDLLGFALFWIIHWTFGLVANVDADEDMIRLSKWRYYYLVGVMKFKELLWPWALGVIVFMAIGII